jgi:hypothetical protein
LGEERRVNWARSCDEETSCVAYKVPGGSFVLLLGNTTEQNKNITQIRSYVKEFYKRCRLNNCFYSTTEYVNTECETETEFREFTTLRSLRGRRRILKGFCARSPRTFKQILFYIFFTL